MSYTVMECVIDLLAASGPQGYRAIVRECRAQATEIYNRKTMDDALIALRKAGILIEADWDEDGIEWNYDFTDYGYELIMDWSANGNARQKAADDHKYSR